MNHTVDGIDANSSSNDSDSSSGETHKVVAFLLFYQRFHGYLSMVICPFSIVSNVVNIIVLTQPKMRSPINYLLSSLAAIDIAKMSTYFLFALNILVLKRPVVSSGFSKFEIIVFLLVAQNLVITLHLTSMIVAIMMAFYRYIIMRSTVTSQRVLTMQGAKLTLVAVTVVAVILCSPNYIQQTAYQADNITDSWWHGPSEFAVNNPKLSSGLSFYIYGLVGKVGGSIVLVVLFGLLLATLREAAESSKKIRAKQDAAKREKGAAGQRRLTMMLVGIVLVFVVAELPQGVLLIMSVQPDFFDQVYTEMGDFLDLLTILSCSVNFILYCSMSKQFRDTFGELFVAPCRSKLARLYGQPRKDSSRTLSVTNRPNKNSSQFNKEPENLTFLRDEDEHALFVPDDHVNAFTIEAHVAN